MTRRNDTCLVVESKKIAKSKLQYIYGGGAGIRSVPVHPGDAYRTGKVILTTRLSSMTRSLIFQASNEELSRFIKFAETVGGFIILTLEQNGWMV
eukprot:UN31519